MKLSYLILGSLGVSVITYAQDLSMIEAKVRMFENGAGTAGVNGGSGTAGVNGGSGTSGIAKTETLFDNGGSGTSGSDSASSIKEWMNDAAQFQIQMEMDRMAIPAIAYDQIMNGYKNFLTAILQKAESPKGSWTAAHAQNALNIVDALEVNQAHTSITFEFLDKAIGQIAKGDQDRAAFAKDYLLWLDRTLFLDKKGEIIFGLSAPVTDALIQHLSVEIAFDLASRPVVQEEVLKLKDIQDAITLRQQINSIISKI